MYLLIILLVLSKAISAVHLWNPIADIIRYSEYSDDSEESLLPKWDQNRVEQSEKLLKQLNLKPLSTGTTIVGLICRDGVVLGADTRSTADKLIMDKDKKKIHFIHNSIHCCGAGTAADCEYITRETKYFMERKYIEDTMCNDIQEVNYVKSAVKKLIAELHNYPEGSTRQKSAVFILGGVDNIDRRPSLYHIDGDGVPNKVIYTALGSGSVDALPILERLTEGIKRIILKSGVEVFDISIEEAVFMVRKAVQAGILNDLGSGSHVDLCAMTKDGTKQWREKLLNRWDAIRKEKLKLSVDQS